mmetsp:Transcript_27545/g.64588  ORF Transcript_27545/g.64588 Transcript_27545/m.64588 type:complete len:86 (-) Transcript_27545:265-522(-)
MNQSTGIWVSFFVVVVVGRGSINCCEYLYLYYLYLYLYCFDDDFGCGKRLFGVTGRHSSSTTLCNSDDVPEREEKEKNKKQTKKT